MSKLRISDAPLLSDVNGSEKIPTGGRGDLAISMDQVKTFAQGGLPQQIEDHINDTENPHQVSKSQVGLGNVDNTSDLDKPVSTAQQAALNLKADKVTTYTKIEVDSRLGLKADKVTTYTKIEVDSRLGLKADKTAVHSKSATLPTYYTKEDGVNSVTGVANGAYFNVRSSSDDTMLVEYQNITGSAVATGKNYPSSAAKWPASSIYDVSGQNQQQINDEVVSIFRFGAICDGTLHTAQEWLDSGRFNSFAQLQNAYPSAVSVNDSIDSLALEKAIAKIGNTGQVRLGGRPVFNKDVRFPENANGIQIFANNVIPVRFVHTGHGFDLSLVNENVGKNVLRNMHIQGIDPTFQAVDYIDQSQGAGIRVNRAYDNTWENVYVSGFKYGIWLRVGFNNKCVGFCGFVGNQYGVYIDGGATNLNHFDGAKIRLNRKAGVVIDGGTTGPYPTKNSFVGSYIETNIPYKGDYLDPPLDGSHSVGVHIKRAYGNDFSGTYFENQDFDVILEDQASYNIFKGIRQAPGGEGFSRQCRLWFKGANINNNDFTGAEYVSWDRTTPSVISDNANQINNKFVDTVGYNFIESSMLCYNNTTISNNASHTALYGTRIAAINRSPTGYASNPAEGVAGGPSATITGIGTSTAVLNANGRGEIILGSTITAPTTIVDITGLRRGQIFILSNYQNEQPVTIKSGTDGVNGLVLAGRKDCVLAARSDAIVFQVSGLGKIIEIARSIAASDNTQSVGTWTPVVKSSGGSTIATSSATGRWVKNGRQLTVWFEISSSVDLVEPNYYTITGMPNLPQFAQNGVGQAASATNPANANQKDIFGVDATTSELRVRVSTQANFSNSDNFAGCATYIIS